MNAIENVPGDISISSIWIHTSGGGRYRVTDFHEGADGYEAEGKLIIRVGYMQLEDGVKRKAGSPYSRSVEDFLANFKQEA
jgi:hypothetical protein